VGQSQSETQPESEDQYSYDDGTGPIAPYYYPPLTSEASSAGRATRASRSGRTSRSSSRGSRGSGSHSQSQSQSHPQSQSTSQSSTAYQGSSTSGGNWGSYNPYPTVRCDPSRGHGRLLSSTPLVCV
jgi:hypothetical protein